MPLRQVAYTGGNTNAAKNVLEEAKQTFDKVGVFPDSKASAMSLPGRLYDLQKAIATGSPYRSGALTGTQYIVLGQQLPTKAVQKGDADAPGDTVLSPAALFAGATALCAAFILLMNAPPATPGGTASKPAPVKPEASSVGLPASYNPSTGKQGDEAQSNGDALDKAVDDMAAADEQRAVSVRGGPDAKARAEGGGRSDAVRAQEKEVGSAEAKQVGSRAEAGKEEEAAAKGRKAEAAAAKGRKAEDAR